MLKLQSLTPTIRLIVACLLLAIGLRTWLVMGLIDPVTVSGSSMVPSHRGTYVQPRCPVCDHSFSLGTEFASNLESMTCPQCRQADMPLAGVPIQRGDRLWIDRLSLNWREPQRWEIVVAHNPHDGNELCIKRVVGLPGEQVDLRDGNVRIDGAIYIKGREDQTRLRQLIYSDASNFSRWQPAETIHWQRNDSSWRHTPIEPAQLAWLRYLHPLNEPITDDVTYNAGITRTLNLVDEFLLSFDLRVRGEGALLLAIDDGTSTAEMRLSFPEGSLELVESGQNRSLLRVPEAAARELFEKTVPVVFSNFDRQLLLTVNDRVLLRRPWPNTSAAGTASPFAIGARGLDLSVSNLSLWRDIYHSTHPVGAAPPTTRRWLLGPGEYFLLGDNPPVSIDSRLWGPVPGRLIIGKPL